MTQHVPVIVGNAQWVLFTWILANQGGVPVPVVPALFAVGALIASGRLSVVTTMAVAVGATLCADLVWYSLARWRGTRTLALIARFSPAARGSVQRGQSLFRDHEGAFRVGARFLPELGPIAAGLAGPAGEVSRALLSTARSPRRSGPGRGWASDIWWARQSPRPRCISASESCSLFSSRSSCTCLCAVPGGTAFCASFGARE